MTAQVVALWRYPVKSMQGERLDALTLDARGVHGDRLFAVRDAQGKFGSGKDTRRFRHIPGLLSFHAAYLNDIPQIRLPDGEVISGDDPGIDAALSAALGQPVQLAREAAVSHLDAGPIHVITRRALASLHGLAPEGDPDARRFRPNLLLDAHDDPAAWLGRRARLGAAELRFTALTERCAMVSCAQQELSKAPQLLRHLAQAHNACFGIYAEVLRPGVIRAGDALTWLFE